MPVSRSKRPALKRTALSRPPTKSVRFIECMECLGVAALPEGREWSYEIKLDGYRLEAVKAGKTVTLYSRRGNVLNKKFGYIADALAKLPALSVLDGELIALGDGDRSDFNLLQNFRSAATRIHYYAFDILTLKGQSLIDVPLNKRRAILADILSVNDHVSLSIVHPGPLRDILKFAKEQALEGIVAKRTDSRYEPGQRSGLWCKHRLNEGQEFVVGGYTPGSLGFDALIIGVYRGKDLMFAGRVRAGFVPATRREVFAQIKDLQIAACPFANLPEKNPGRWGQGLTAEKMKDCVWLKPKTVVRIDFAEWTGAEKLRHTKFVAMRFDKDPRKVVREVN